MSRGRGVAPGTAALAVTQSLRIRTWFRTLRALPNRPKKRAPSGAECALNLQDRWRQGLVVAASQLAFVAQAQADPAEWTTRHFGPAILSAPSAVSARQPTLATGSPDEPSANAQALSALEPMQGGSPVIGTLGPTVQADAETARADGVYGRFEGDLTLALAAGAELESQGQRGLLYMAAHYYWMAGITASYREALGASREELTTLRLGSVGVDIRPLFIPRWSYGWQSGPPTFDLFIDSVSMAAGAYFADTQPLDRSQRRGFEASLGAAVPLLGSAPGPWLAARYVRRWPEAGSSEGSVWVSLAWHVLVGSGLATNTADVH